jgi:hypothetical protein
MLWNITENGISVLCKSLNVITLVHGKTYDIDEMRTILKLKLNVKELCL